VAKPTIFRKEEVKEFLKKGDWESLTWSDIWDRNGALYPDKEALVDSKTRLTWGQAKKAIDRIALGFLELGFKKDEVIIVQLPNWVEIILTRIACEKAGLICLQVLRTFRETEVEYILKRTEASGVVIPWKHGDFDYLDMVRQVRPPSLRHIFIVGKQAPKGTISLNRMMQEPLEKKYPPDYLERTKMPPLEFSLVFHTTGTTGLSKFTEWPTAGCIARWKENVEKLHLVPTDVIGVFAPAAGGPNNAAYFGAPMVAAKVVMQERFEAGEALELIEKEKITVVSVVPTILQRMLAHPDFNKRDLSSVRLITTVGSGLPSNVAMEAEEKFHAAVLQKYGSMDCGASTSNSADDPAEVRWLSVGKPSKFDEIKLVDDEGKEVPRGEPGEIWFRARSGASGYFKDPEGTSKTWGKEGWFPMGDLGRLDEKGNLFIVGRKKDMIIRGGQNIYPAEVENILLTNPKIAQVAVVKMPDPEFGERACAYVVPKEGSKLTFKEMVDFLESKNIAKYKLPERLEIVSSLPLAGETKIDKKMLEKDIISKLRLEGKIA
jgi:non-ribosomal peptide synthetase component E (peptide arylation enzyme)